MWAESGVSGQYPGWMWGECGVSGHYPGWMWGESGLDQGGILAESRQPRSDRCGLDQGGILAESGQPRSDRAGADVQTQDRTQIGSPDRSIVFARIGPRWVRYVCASWDTEKPTTAPNVIMTIVDVENC